MDSAADGPRDHHLRVQSDPHFLRESNLCHSDGAASGGYANQMGSARRDARVVCESFSSGRNFGSPKMRPSASQKAFRGHARRRNGSMAYSRNPLLACFLGESVLSGRSIHLSPNCDSSGSSQRTFFSLIPVDKSRVNEKTEEPQSPQLSCIGQVKQRQVKLAKPVDVGTEDLARMDINDGMIPESVVHVTKPAEKFHKLEPFKLLNGEPFKLQSTDSFRLRLEDSFRLQKEAFKLQVETFKLRKEESFKVQKEEAFRRQKEESLKFQKEVSFKLQRRELPVLDKAVEDIPYLDLAGGTTKPIESVPDVPLPLPPVESDCVKNINAARLTRCRRVVEEEEKVSSPTHRNSIRYLNHFLKQKLGASMVKTGLVCGWSSGETSPRSPKSDTEAEHCEIDLSRFDSRDFQPKTPSFKDTRCSNYSAVPAKKAAAIRVSTGAQQPPLESCCDRDPWKKQVDGKEQGDVCLDAGSEETADFPIVLKCSPSTVILRPVTDAALWKRRCVPRPIVLDG